MKGLIYGFGLLGVLLVTGSIQAMTPLRRPGDPPVAAPKRWESAPLAATKHIPILALYTPERLAAAGSLAGLTAELDDELFALNQSIQVTGFPDYDFYFAAIQPADHHDSGTIAHDFDWLDAAWPEERILAAGVRLAHLFVRSGTDLGGISSGFRETASPSVSGVPESAQAGIFVFAHEIGHGLGLSHDPENTAPRGDQGWPNGHGFRMAGYRDVMAYPNNCVERFGSDCPIAAGYSDPARTRSGLPLGVSGVSEAVAVLRETLPYYAGDTTCAASGVRLCLNNHRFKVQTLWQTAENHNENLGQAIPRTTDTGEFWFFAPTNIELIVKVLDACTFTPPHYWVFAGGLTNVNVTLIVTDTRTGTSRFYLNPLGKAFQPVQDVAAFPCN